MAKLESETSPLRGAQTIALSVKSGGTHAIDLYVDVENDKLAREDAQLIRAWAMSPPDSVEPPWTDLLQSARVKVRDRRIVVSLDASSLSKTR